ncbi:MAG: DUF349 domain-containing protein, partial [Bowdeniella nasicola]|nr:DUF349 domain-containing protein [Bowdeniella nasicola]
RDGEGERMVGQYPDVPTEEALKFYVQRFLDLEAEVALAESRMPQLPGGDVDKLIATLRQSVAAPAAVGDLESLRKRVEALAVAGEERKAIAQREREEAKAAAVAEREAIVQQVEEIADRDPQRVQWRQSGQQIRDLLEEWKAAQRRGPRLDRAVEDALWKRFSQARTSFDRKRRQFFNELDARQKEAKAKKEALIERAEAMNTSTDWGRTTVAYRQLMDEWKAAGRAHRKEDDALWKRFRAAQQVFFDARKIANEQTDAEQQENLRLKRELCDQAEALLPITDPDAARTQLRPLQEAWENIGFVPRKSMNEVEGRMRAVEDAIRKVEAEQWRQSDPEVQARRSSLATQIEAALEKLDSQIAKAQAAGNETKVAKLQDERQAKQAWLDQIS